jgi:hypothetical protein
MTTMTSRGGEVKRFLPEHISGLSSTYTQYTHIRVYIYTVYRIIHENRRGYFYTRGSVDRTDGKFNPIYCRTNYIVHIYILNDEWRGCTITEVSEIENNAQTDFNNKIAKKKTTREKTNTVDLSCIFFANARESERKHP